MGQAKQRGTFEERKANAKPKVKHGNYSLLNDFGFPSMTGLISGLINLRRKRLHKK